MTKFAAYTADSIYGTGETAESAIQDACMLIYGEDAIYGTGETAESAIQDACLWINAEDAKNFRETCKTAQMTPALEALVDSVGGDCSFIKLPCTDLLGTYEEYENME